MNKRVCRFFMLVGVVQKRWQFLLCFNFSILVLRALEAIIVSDKKLSSISLVVVQFRLGFGEIALRTFLMNFNRVWVLKGYSSFRPASMLHR